MEDPRVTKTTHDNGDGTKLVRAEAIIPKAYDMKVIIVKNGRKFGLGRKRKESPEGVTIDTPIVETPGEVAHIPTTDSDHGIPGEVIPGPETIGGDIHSPAGSTPTIGDSDYVQEEEISKDEDEKKKSIILGKAIKIGTISLASLLAALGVAGILTAKSVDYTDYAQLSEQHSSLISDFDTKSGSTIVLPNGTTIELDSETAYSYDRQESQLANPGTIISELREKGLGENLGRNSGRQEYDATPESERVAEEEQINEITNSFQENQNRIQELSRKIADPSISAEEKLEVEHELVELYNKQLSIFESATPVYEQYFSKAWEIYGSPEDDRTADDRGNLIEDANSWNNSIANITTNRDNYLGIIYTAENPELDFVDVSVIPGKATNISTGRTETYSVDKDTYYIDLGPIEFFGHELLADGIHIFPKEEITTTDESYDYDLEGGTVAGGAVGQGVITEENLHSFSKRVERHGIDAFAHDFSSWFKGLAEKITGKNLTDTRADDYEGK